MERELLYLHHSYGRLREVARDLGLDAVGLPCTYPLGDPNLHTSFGMLCRVVLDYLGHVQLACVLLLFFLFLYMSYVISIPASMEKSFVNC